MMERFSHVDTWVFDLDNTLYDAETEVFVRIGERMTDFVVDLMRVPREEASVIRKGYWKKYGTTLRGLMTEHGVEPESFLNHVHDIDISDVPQCAITAEYLARLPGKKIVFTNSARPFATRMIRHLGIDRHFDHLFTIEDADFYPKPNPGTYNAVIERLSFDPRRACMFEDMEANLKPAADLGMTTVWFHGKHQSPDEGNHPHIHHKAEKLSDWLQHTIRKA